MKFVIKEILVSCDRVIVRGEVTGTPAGDLFGVPHTGKSFRIMAIDIQTIRDGKIARTYHLENWLSALGQRSEEHTSELQSRLHLVCRLLLEKKKKTAKRNIASTVHTTVTC